MLQNPVTHPGLLEAYERLAAKTPELLLGRWRNPIRNGEEVYLTDSADRFVGLFAPTRSGKGVSFVIPNALTWSHSLFCNDPKREVSSASAYFRRHYLGQHIFLVDPYDDTGTGARICLTDEIRVRTGFEIIDSMNFATAVVDPDGSGVWKKRARDLLTGVLLHVLWSDEFPNKSLKTCIDFVTDPKTSFREKLHRMLSYDHDREGRYGWRHVDGTITKTHPFIASAVRQQMDRAEAEAGSVKSEYESYLSIYRDNLIADNTTVSDFSIADIVDGIAPATVYMSINPANIETAKPFIRLFLNLLINRNLVPLYFDEVTGRQKQAHRWKLAMLLDEFTSTLGRLDIFARQLAYIAGYGFKPAIVIQDMEQLFETYGRYENITSNCHIQIFGAMNKPVSAEHFSKALGMRTIGYEQFSHAVGGQRNVTEHTTGIPLLSPSQIQQLSEDQAVMLMGGQKPVPMYKLRFYDDDSALAGRAIPAPVDFESDRIPYSRQVGRRNRAELEASYLQRCQRQSVEQLSGQGYTQTEQYEKFRLSATGDLGGTAA